MARATFSGQYGHNLTLEVWSDWNTQDVAGNRSTVNVQARLITNGYASMWSLTGRATITVDGNQTQQDIGLNIGTNSNPAIYGRDFQVAHNGDGTKRVGISFRLDINAYGYGWAQASFELPLPTIARASEVRVGSASFGSPMTIAIDRKNASFKHRIRYAFGSDSATIASDVDTSYSWTVPVALANNIPNNTSGVGTIYVDTLSAGRVIGTRQATFTATVPESAKPRLSGITLTDSNDRVSQLLAKANTFVQVLSNIKVAFKGASGAYGSSISSFRAEIEGKNQFTNSDGGALGLMAFNGSVTIKASVTDSRGRTSNTITQTVTVLPYFTPQLTFSAKRVANNKLLLSRTARIAPLVVDGKQKNQFDLRFKYRAVNTSSYSNDTGAANMTSLTMAGLTNSEANLGASFNSLQSYEIVGVLSDLFTNYEFKVTVGTESFPIAFKPTAVGLGKTPENQNSVDSDWVYRYKNKPIQHYQLTQETGRALRLDNNTDLNTIVFSGFYIGANLINAPRASNQHSWTYIRVSRDNDNWVLQEAIDFNGVVSAYRVKLNGNWQPWKTYAMQGSVASFTAVNQTKVYRATLAGPYGLSAQASRCGNIVNLSLNLVYGRTHAVEGQANETLPLGWRPTTPQIITLTGHAGGGVGTENWSDSFVDLHYETDGKINFTIKTKANPLALMGSLTWITTDPFPV